MEKESVANDAVERLILAGELDNNREDEKSANSGRGQDHNEAQHQLQEIEQVETPVLVCYTVGPFGDMGSARQASSTLDKSGLVTETRETEDRKRTGYWVRLPVENTLASARRIVQGLKDRKISDISVVPLDDGRYAISLGVFSMEHTAQRRYSQFVSMGFAPQIEDRYKITTVIWIDVKDSEPSLLAPETWRDLTGKYNGIGRSEIACE